MAQKPQEDSARRRWAQLKLEIIGELLDPPAHGELSARLRRLAGRVWKTPDGSSRVFGQSSIERWYYACRTADDPVAALMRQTRKDRNRRRALSPEHCDALWAQYKLHPSWSYQLHADNLAVLCEREPNRFGSKPSYATVRRHMRRRGWFQKPKARSKGKQRAERRRQHFETRSYETECVHALWHLDFHFGRRKVVDRRGVYHTPLCLCVLDDCSRLGCHAQWYLAEGAAELVHGLCQAFAKRGLPRAVMHDNGSAMKAAETLQGLADMSVESEPTLEYSPHQNGKQEVFWGQIEGRLMAMLENIEPLTLDVLNRATIAWLECEYNKKYHREIATTPWQRAEQNTDVSRPSWDADKTRRAFTMKRTRIQRRTDGTISVQGVRFELPSRLRTLRQVWVRYARWDLSQAWVVDPDSNDVIASVLPCDKARNADARRRLVEPISQMAPSEQAERGAEPIPPLMSQLLQEYAATGLPPAFLPKD